MTRINAVVSRTAIAGTGTPFVALKPLPLFHSTSTATPPIPLAGHMPDDRDFDLSLDLDHDHDHDHDHELAERPGGGPTLPQSVRGAPAHLRQVIRKRQNSESAKRSRLRRKEAARRFYNHFDQQCKRISSLEKRVRELAELVRREEEEEGEDCDKDEELSDAPQSLAQDTSEEQCQSFNASQHVTPLHTATPQAAMPTVEAAAQPRGEDHVAAFVKDLDDLLDSCMTAHVEYVENEGYSQWNRPCY